MLELDYLLAYADVVGTDGLATGFRTRARDADGLDWALLTELTRRGFAAQFPQASVAPEFYLPFAANLVLEVADWRGKTSRFGSTPNLVQELREILAMIATADPAAAAAGQRDVPQTDRLAAAFNAARLKLGLAEVGLRQNLPFWLSE